MSCSHCKRTLPLSSFLANASADLGSRVFATCLHCRERSRSRRRASQPFHLHNLSSLAQLQSQHIKSRGPCRHPCATSPGAGFLPAEQWGYIRDFHKELDEVRMETCSRCQERWFAMDLKDGICHSCFLRDKGLPSELDVVVLQPPDQVMETDPRYPRQFRSDFLGSAKGE